MKTQKLNSNELSSIQGGGMQCTVAVYPKNSTVVPTGNTVGADYDYCKGWYDLAVQQNPNSNVKMTFYNSSDGSGYQSLTYTPPTTTP